jgi:hypothetical protein
MHKSLLGIDPMRNVGVPHIGAVKSFAGFVSPDVYEFLEAERIKYTISSVFSGNRK